MSSDLIGVWNRLSKAEQQNFLAYAQANLETVKTHGGKAFENMACDLPIWENILDPNLCPQFLKDIPQNVSKGELYCSGQKFEGIVPYERYTDFGNGKATIFILYAFGGRNLIWGNHLGFGGRGQLKVMLSEQGYVDQQS